MPQSDFLMASGKFDIMPLTLHFIENGIGPGIFEQKPFKMSLDGKILPGDK